MAATSGREVERCEEGICARSEEGSSRVAAASVQKALRERYMASLAEEYHGVGGRMETWERGCVWGS